MSVEAQASGSLRRAAFWRCVVVAAELPRGVFGALSDFCEGVSCAAFYLELDAATRYRLISGVDVGVGAGEPFRYSGMTPEALARRDALVDDAEDD